MNTHLSAAFLAVASVAAIAQADTVTGGFVGEDPGYSRDIAIHVADAPQWNGTFVVGPLDHTFTSGTGTMGAALAGRTVPTFCIELQYVNNSLSNVYNIVPIAQAPTPITSNPSGPGPYGQTREDRVNAIIGAAMQLGWLNGHGIIQNSGNGATNADRGAAIQLLVWDSVFETDANLATWSLADGNFTADLTNFLGVSNDIAALINAATPLYAQRYHVGGLVAISSADSQDQILVVPLPAAVFAGAGSLAALAGMGFVRRRRLARA